MKEIIVLSMLLFSMFIQAQEEKREYYVTTNVFSPLAGMNTQIPAIKVLSPLISNLEYGVTLSGGFFQKHHFIECRLTLGQSLPYNFIPQFQVGYQFLISDYFKKNESGFYTGVNLRYWDYINKYTKSQRHNIVPNINVGYVWKKKRLLVDLRLHQSIAIFTKTNIDHTRVHFNFNFSPMPKFSPVLPFLSLNVGWIFKNELK